MPDERLRQWTHGGCIGCGRVQRVRVSERSGSRAPEHMPYPGEGHRKDLLRARTVQANEGREPRPEDRCRRMRGSSRGRGNHSPAADGRYRRRAAILSQTAVFARKRGGRQETGGHGVSGGRQIREAAQSDVQAPQPFRIPFCARGVRQILHVLRRPLHARRRSEQTCETDS